jgi:hypothetical protein
VLNPLGARIWELLETPRAEDDLAEILVSLYRNLSYEQALADVTGFMSSLVDQDLVIRDA